MQHVLTMLETEPYHCERKPHELLLLLLLGDCYDDAASAGRVGMETLSARSGQAAYEVGRTLQHLIVHFDDFAIDLDGPLGGAVTYRFDGFDGFDMAAAWDDFRERNGLPPAPLSAPPLAPPTLPFRSRGGAL